VLFICPQNLLTEADMALTLEFVETTIEQVMATGQSTSVDGMSYTAASLPHLWEMRKQLKEEIRAATRPTGRGVKFAAMGYQ
jgi:hypothetical protein